MLRDFFAKQAGQGAVMLIVIIRRDLYSCRGAYADVWAVTALKLATLASLGGLSCRFIFSAISSKHSRNYYALVVL